VSELAEFNDDFDEPEETEGICYECGAGPDEECEFDCDCDECEGIEE
jgi:hypothetical protein